METIPEVLTNMTRKTGRKRRKPIASGLLTGGVATALLLALAATAFAAEYLFVVQQEAAIRKKKSMIGGILAMVHEEDKLTKLGEDGSWYRVEFLGTEGWIPKTAVSDDGDIVFSGEALASGVRATEQAAGGRGFNPEVEQKYKAQRTDLGKAYEIIDAIQERKVPEDRVERFVIEGKLAGAEVAETGERSRTPLASGPASAGRPAGKTAPSAPWKN